jgi:hypothetical protein
MTAQNGQFSRVALIRVLPDRELLGRLRGSAFRHHLPQSGPWSRSHRNPVPSWHYTHGRAGWREGS